MKAIAAYVHQPDAAAQVPVVDPSRLFYVTVRSSTRTGWLLGPYDSHADALASVARGRGLAMDADPRASFYSYGTASLPRDSQQPTVVFGL